MRDYFLETERLGFSIWATADGGFAKALWGDSLVTRYIIATGVFTQQQINERLCLEIENQEKYGVQYWPVFEKSVRCVYRVLRPAAA